MGRRLKRLNIWVRRRSHLTLIVILGLLVVLLFFNEDTSLSQNMEYQREINDLKQQIQLNKDSAKYYKKKREDVLAGRDELEHLARERFNMQRPTEDVYELR